MMKRGNGGMVKSEKGNGEIVKRGNGEMVEG